MIVTKDFAGDLQGWLHLVWKLEPELTDGFIDLLADLAVLSHKDVAARPGWRDRQNSHLSAIEDARGCPGVRYGLFRDEQPGAIIRGRDGVLTIDG